MAGTERRLPRVGTEPNQTEPGSRATARPLVKSRWFARPALCLSNLNRRPSAAALLRCHRKEQEVPWKGCLFNLSAPALPLERTGGALERLSVQSQPRTLRAALLSPRLTPRSLGSSWLPCVLLSGTEKGNKERGVGRGTDAPRVLGYG